MKYRVQDALREFLNGNMGEVRCKDNTIIQALKDWLDYPACLNRVRMSRKSTQNTTINILSLKSTSLDIDELSCNKVLLYLFNSIYIYRLVPTQRKAHKLSKVSIGIVCYYMICYFFVNCIMGNKVCVESM